MVSAAVKPRSHIIILILILALLIFASVILMLILRMPASDPQNLPITRVSLDLIPTITPFPIQSRSDLDRINLPEPMVWRKAKQISPGVLIAINWDEQAIIQYNVTDDDHTELVSVSADDRYIESFTGNAEWLVWIEDEMILYDTSNKSYQWELLACNLLTGERISIDKSLFTTNQFNVPMFVEFVPSGLVISNQNTVAYCRTLPNGETIASEVVTFDLENGQMQVIDRADDILQEMIAYCCIQDSRVAWSRFSQLQDTYEQRLTQYLYSDLFLYDQANSTITQLTSQQFYNEPVIYGDKMAAIRIPDKPEDQFACNSEVVLIDLTTLEERVIVDENSPCYTRREHQMYRTLPHINDRYISWYNNMMSQRFLYDYQNQTYVELNEDLAYVGRIDTIIWNMFDDAILIGIFDDDEDHTQNLYYISLP